MGRIFRSKVLVIVKIALLIACSIQANIFWEALQDVLFAVCVKEDTFYYIWKWVLCNMESPFVLYSNKSSDSNSQYVLKK